MDSDQGKLFIGGISWETTEERLREYFGKYGEVAQAVIMRDKVTGRPRGFGFVVFSDPSVVDRVLQDKHTIDGRNVEAKRALSREEQNTSFRSGNSASARPTGGSGGTTQKTKKIFVGGLAPTLSEEEFRKYFEAYGSVTDVVVMYDQNTQRPRGFGFISFDTEDAVDRVLHKTFHDLGGKLVEVKRAMPKDTIGQGGGGGRAFGYGGPQSGSGYEGRTDGNRFMPPQSGGGFPPYGSSGYGGPGFGYGGATNGVNYGGFGMGGYGGPGGAYGNPNGPGGYGPPGGPRSGWGNQPPSGYGSGYGSGGWNGPGGGGSGGGMPAGQSPGSGSYGNQGYGYGGYGGGAGSGSGGGDYGSRGGSGDHHGSGSGYMGGGGYGDASGGYAGSWKSDSSQGGGYGGGQGGYGGYGGAQGRQS